MKRQDPIMQLQDLVLSMVTPIATAWEEDQE